MGEIRYMISETAKQVDVEAHVLRYWEEELSLPIDRNEMGHRYYTEDDISLFKNIKELKEQGFQLKAIKMLLPELRKKGGFNMDRLLEKKEAEDLYRMFGAALRDLPPKWRVLVLSSHTEFERCFGRPADKKRKLYNGMIKCDAFMYGR